MLDRSTHKSPLRAPSNAALKLHVGSVAWRQFLPCIQWNTIAGHECCAELHAKRYMQVRRQGSSRTHRLSASPLSTFALLLLLPPVLVLALFVLASGPSPCWLASTAPPCFFFFCRPNGNMTSKDGSQLSAPTCMCHAK